MTESFISMSKQTISSTLKIRIKFKPDVINLHPKMPKAKTLIVETGKVPSFAGPTISWMQKIVVRKNRKDVTNCKREKVEKGESILPATLLAPYLQPKREKHVTFNKKIDYKVFNVNEFNGSTSSSISDVETPTRSRFEVHESLQKKIFVLPMQCMP